MTTFTSEDRESVYKHDVPTNIVDSGASVDDREDSMQMLREQIHAQQCEINALRKALMYAHPIKQLSDEEIVEIYKKIHGWDVKIGDKNWIGFARAIIKEITE